MLHASFLLCVSSHMPFVQVHTSINLTIDQNLQLHLLRKVYKVVQFWGHTIGIEGVVSSEIVFYEHAHQRYCLLGHFHSSSKGKYS